MGPVPYMVKMRAKRKRGYHFEISKIKSNFAKFFPIRKLNIKTIKTMTKAEIVNEVAKTTGIEKAQVLAVIEEFTTVVKGSLIAGNPVYMRGFGSFIIKHRAQKAARNITRKTTMTIPAHDIPAFKPAKSFVNAVKEK